MKKHRMGMTLAFSLSLLVLFPFFAEAAAPLETIQTQVGKALDVLRDPALKTDAAKEAKENKIWAIAEDIFDFTELSKRTMGRDWNKLNEDQQKEFTGLFSKILGNVYLDRIMAYTDEKVVFNKESVLAKDKAEVQSKVITASGEIPIHYRMINMKGSWKVYDVVIEGVSMVKNYRVQFKEILKNDSPKDLLEILRKKVEKKPQIVSQ
jgi:phospholipid transport system substrate-binding protein